MSAKPATTAFQKFFMEFIDETGKKRQYQCESTDKDGSGLSLIELPFNFNKFNYEKPTVRFFAEFGTSDTIDNLDYFKFIVLGKDKCGVEDEAKLREFDRRKNQSNMFREIQPDYFVTSDDDEKGFPEISYRDVTERDMFGYPAIPSHQLITENGGIWSMHGFRKLEITVKGIPEFSGTDRRLKACLYWYRIDAREIAPLFEDEIRLVKSQSNDEAGEQNFIAYIDTNRLGEALQDEKYPLFSGRFELHYSIRGENSVYAFPIELCVHNTRLVNLKNHLMDKNPVSIDFGTSASCAAVNDKESGKAKLFRLSGSEKIGNDSKDNPYENPTNLMIYRWDEIYKQWQAANQNCPFVLTNDGQEADKTKAAYDSGYTVEDEYQNVGSGADSRRKMLSIMTLLKMIPTRIATGEQITFTSYYGAGGKEAIPIKITDSIDENDDQTFNPIAFYGYLMSRVINSPTNHVFYPNYQITYPVKFNKTTVEKIRLSLEYGIKRALPRDLQNAVNKKGNPLVTVQMVYPEPIACAGAIVGKQLKLDSLSPQPKLFAIYDLGGGTVDFAFGMFRQATEDEIDEGSADYVIENFGTDGDEKLGGEKLIHRLAFKIYLDNRELMKEYQIPFVLPEGETQKDGFEELLSYRGNDIANSNVYVLKENLARKLFVYPGVNENDIQMSADDNLEELFPSDAENVVFSGAGQLNFSSLRKADNSEAGELTLEVSGIDKFLKQELQKIILSFKSTMERNFKRNVESMNAAGIYDFNVDDVHIFLGGNASKQHFVKELMAEIFPVNEEREHIQRIGETHEEKDAAMFTINEKTAVAFGQLRLGGIGYVNAGDASDSDSPSFLFHVGYIDHGTDQFITVIGKGDKRKWCKANRIVRATGATDLFFTGDLTPTRKALKPLSEDVSDFVEDNRKLTLFIRINTENSIEFRLGTPRDIPSDDEPVDEDMILWIRG